MDPKKAKIVSTSLVLSLIVAMAVLGRCLGPTSHEFLAAAAVCVAAILAVFVFLLLQFSLLDRRRRLSMKRRAALDGARHLRSDYSFLRKVAGVPVRFKHEAISRATDGFSSSVGRGSTSTVFRGVLEDGTAVAVKRLEAAEGDSRGDRAFRSEVAAIASVQHVNLVRLLGYSDGDGDGHRYLVYEYIHNGSLDRWIFPRKEVATATAAGKPAGECLPWKLRYRVAVDVARALAYLHHDCRQRVLHLDVKPENILLDEGFNACVADFGLSKLMRRDQSRVLTTVRGTRGYLAPEWLMENGVTEKSDVYSYGMVLFELVGGRRNVTAEEGEDGRRRWSYFPSVVAEREREGRLMEVVDGRLAGVEEKEARALVWVALWCVQEEAKLRPSMKAVVDMLEGRSEVERPPETEMLIVDLLTLGDSGQDSRPVRLPAALQLRTPVLSSLGSIVSELSAR